MAATTPAGNTDMPQPPPPLLPIAATTAKTVVQPTPATLAPTTPAPTTPTTSVVTAEVSDSKRLRVDTNPAVCLRLTRRGPSIQVQLSRYGDSFIDKIVVVPAPPSIGMAPNIVVCSHNPSGASIIVFRNGIHCLALLILPSAVTLYEFKFPNDALHDDVLKAVYADAHGFGCRATIAKGFSLPEYIIWCSTSVTNYGDYKSLTDDALVAGITKSYVGSTCVTSRRIPGSDVLFASVLRGNSPSQVAALEAAKKHLPAIEIPSACIHRVAPISSVETIVSIPLTSF